jgi:hypothetical protein
MNICILCQDKDIAEVRQKAKQIEQFAKHTALAIPLSETGEPMPTHWFCTLSPSPEVYEQIKALQNLSEVVEAEPRAFLESRKLKAISVKKIVKALRAARKGNKE